MDAGFDLARGIRSLESDYYSTAEVWKAENRRFVIVWALDTETTMRFTYCFAGDGSVRFAESRLWAIPYKSGAGWSFRRRWLPGKAGRLVAQQVSFTDLQGKPILRPSLNADDRKNIDFIQDVRKLRDLKLPLKMVR